MNIYLDLTREFNEGHLRCVISSGQAVVLHRLAIMSKDGDWIIRENEESTRHALSVLSKHGARYRFGAPLDIRWLAGGWSSHFEFHHEDLRVRTDFVSRPPRLSTDDMASLWRELEIQDPDPPVIDPRRLAELKKTNREKDYAVIGELARLITDVRDQFLLSRSATDLIELAKVHPTMADELTSKRPVLGAIRQGRDGLEAALDAERRQLIHANEQRLDAYASAAEAWYTEWPQIEKQTQGMNLIESHRLITERAADILPKSP